jgi:hypothetical protein
MQTASETGSSSTGTMSNPQPQGSIEEDTNQTPRAHTPATPTVGSYEWALEQKQQLVDNPPPLVTEDALRQEKIYQHFYGRPCHFGHFSISQHLATFCSQMQHRKQYCCNLPPNAALQIMALHFATKCCLANSGIIFYRKMHN